MAELRTRLRPFRQKHRLRRHEIFGSAARGLADSGRDVDLLVTPDDSQPVSTAELLELAGEAEELVGTPVDFSLRRRWKPRQLVLPTRTFWLCALCVCES